MLIITRKLTNVNPKLTNVNFGTEPLPAFSASTPTSSAPGHSAFQADFRPFPRHPRVIPAPSSRHSRAIPGELLFLFFQADALQGHVTPFSARVPLPLPARSSASCYCEQQGGIHR